MKVLADSALGSRIDVRGIPMLSSQQPHTISHLPLGPLNGYEYRCKMPVNVMVSSTSSRLKVLRMDARDGNTALTDLRFLPLRQFMCAVSRCC